MNEKFDVRTWIHTYYNIHTNLVRFMSHSYLNIHIKINILFFPINLNPLSRGSGYATGSNEKTSIYFG